MTKRTITKDEMSQAGTGKSLSNMVFKVLRCLIFTKRWSGILGCDIYILKLV